MGEGRDTCTWRKAGSTFLGLDMSAEVNFAGCKCSFEKWVKRVTASIFQRYKVQEKPDRRIHQSEDSINSLKSKKGDRLTSSSCSTDLTGDVFRDNHPPSSPVDLGQLGSWLEGSRLKLSQPFFLRRGQLSLGQ